MEWDGTEISERHAGNPTPVAGRRCPHAPLTDRLLAVPIRAGTPRTRPRGESGVVASASTELHPSTAGRRPALGLRRARHHVAPAASPSGGAARTRGRPDRHWEPRPSRNRLFPALRHDSPRAITCRPTQGSLSAGGPALRMRDDSRDPRVASAAAADEASQEESCLVPKREGKQGKGRGGDARVTATAVSPATESTKQASRARLSLPGRLVLLVGFTIMLVSCLSGALGFFYCSNPVFCLVYLV
jgi:hypothetical protein